MTKHIYNEHIFFIYTYKYIYKTDVSPPLYIMNYFCYIYLLLLIFYIFCICTGNGSNCRYSYIVRPAASI